MGEASKYFSREGSSGGGVPRAQGMVPKTEPVDYNEQGSGSGFGGGVPQPQGNVPKTEPLDFELSAECSSSRQFRDNIASSSGSNVRSNLLGMGFSPCLIDKAMKEKGEEDFELLLETLLGYPAQRVSNSESSSSLDDLFDEDDESHLLEVSNMVEPKQEPDAVHVINDDKRASLLAMNFSINEIEFALDKLGNNTPVSELVDFIFAAQIAAKAAKEVDGATNNGVQDKNEDPTDETLYGTMEKTLRLLEMGFSENQVSAAIERFGSEAPISELADSIFADQAAVDSPETKFSPNTSGNGGGPRCYSSNSVTVKIEDFDPHTVSQLDDINGDTNGRGKRLKQEYGGDVLNAPHVGHMEFTEMGTRKRPKHEYLNGSSSFSSSTCEENNIDSKVDTFRVPRQPSSSKCLDQTMAKRPYFFYGNVANISHDSWATISRFLFAVKPEFVNSQFFSALNRKEGYIHNLPTENRSRIFPESPITIEDAIPHTKRWWPSWDTRKQLTCINSDTSGISEVCNRLERILLDSRGLPSSEQEKEIIHQCRTRNLVWIGRYKLAPIEPEHLECILGYPPKHTEGAEISLLDRLEALKYSFQTDTLGYHLSVLKSLFPNGVTVLSVFSGIGGAEIALHRLGIHLKGVVSIEISGTKRKLLSRWWNHTGQVGELVQIGDIQRLTTTKLENLIERFGGFDLVICRNPCGRSTSKVAADSDSFVGFDFPLFYEFVRVLQRVKHVMERTSLC